MKTIFQFLAITIASLTISSCSNGLDEMLDVQNEQTTSQDSVFTYDMYFDSEIISYDGGTRATTASDWENGDVVYLYFRGNNDAYGKAVYYSSSKKWTVTSNKALSDDSNAECYVWCGKGSNAKTYTNYISYQYMTEAYSTYSGKYTYTNNNIYVNATMQPKGWRIRFKGTAGTVIQVNESTGFYHFYKMFHSSKYGFEDGSRSIFTLTVGSNGYTDYFVGYTENNCNCIIIKNLNSGNTYYHYFDASTLNWGESGYFTIPTTTNLYGWTSADAINGQAYVNLGLPSGMKWTTCNIGASSLEKAGNYYAWGETTNK